MVKDRDPNSERDFATLQSFLFVVLYSKFIVQNTRLKNMSR